MASRERHLDERVNIERYSTEHEALSRARELIERDDAVAVEICDAAGTPLISGVRLQLRLGFTACE